MTQLGLVRLSPCPESVLDIYTHQITLKTMK